MALAAAFQLAALRHDSAREREQVSRAQPDTNAASPNSFPPALSRAEEAAAAASFEAGAAAEDAAFQTKMNALAETNPREYDRYVDEMRARASKAIGRATETPWQTRRRHTLQRKQQRRALRGALPPDLPKFAKKQVSAEDQRYLDKKLKKKAKKDAAKKRLDGYKDRAAKKAAGGA